MLLQNLVNVLKTNVFQFIQQLFLIPRVVLTKFGLYEIPLKSDSSVLLTLLFSSSEESSDGVVMSIMNDPSLAERT